MELLRHRSEVEKVVREKRKNKEIWGGIWQMRLARCRLQLNSKLSLVGRGYSWMGDHLGIASCWFSTRGRVVVVGLSRASRVFLRVLRFSSLRKINLSLIHLSLTGPPLITVFLHWRGLPCIKIMLSLLLLLLLLSLFLSLNFQMKKKLLLLYIIIFYYSFSFFFN